MISDHSENIRNLCKVLLLLETDVEAYNFLKDLCTPSELNALAERWQVCKYLNEDLSYREIQVITGASLTTIGRVARFLKQESYRGYELLLKRIKDK